MKAINQLRFEKHEKKIKENRAYAFSFLGFLMLNAGFGDLQNLEYFFLNFSGLLALGTVLISFIGLHILQSKGIKLKSARAILAYQFSLLLMSGVMYCHYYLVVKGALPF